MEVLFGKEIYPENCGVYIFGNPGDTGWFFNLVRVIPFLDKHGNIAGAKFGIGGLAFLLAFGKPIFHEDGIKSLYRPKCIEIRKNGVVKRIDFLWPDNIRRGSLLLDFRSRIENTKNPIIRPIVMPIRKRNENESR